MMGESDLAIADSPLPQLLANHAYQQYPSEVNSKNAMLPPSAPNPRRMASYGSESGGYAQGISPHPPDYLFCLVFMSFFFLFFIYLLCL